MAVDQIRYDLLAQDALRGVVRRVLADVAVHGLPGEHHFFISFDTRADGVKISSRLLEKYPEDMTLVLQHQFWDLVVAEDHFEVGVSFNGIPERVSVPFAAIKGFFDPSVQFGLQFELAAEPAAAGKDQAQDTDAKTSAAPQPRPALRGAASEPEERPARPSVPTTKKPAEPAKAEPAPAEDDKASGAEVVRLDKFRKK